MGFGLIFIGYALLITWGLQIDAATGLGLDILPDFVGYLLIYRGLKGLRPYSKGFVLARLLTLPLMVVGGAILGIQLFALCGRWIPDIRNLYSVLGTAAEWADILSLPLLCFFHIYLCQGIRELAAEVDLPKVIFRAKVVPLLSVVYSVGRLLMGVDLLPAIGMWLLLILQFVLYFYCLVMIYSCYMHIVYADETPEEAVHPLARLLNKFKAPDSEEQ